MDMKITSSKVTILAGVLSGLLFALVLLVIMPNSMKVLGRWQVTKPKFFAVNFPNRETEYRTRVIEAHFDPDKLRVEVKNVFSDLKRYDDRQRESAFESLFGPRSYWSEILAERDHLLRDVFGDAQYLSHPNKEQLDIMALVLIGKIRMLEEQRRKINM